MLSAEVKDRVAGLLSGRRGIAVATAAAVAATLGCYAAARLSGEELLVTGRGDATSVPVGAVVVATLTGAAGGVVLAGLARRTRRPRSRFLLLAGVAFGAALVPPVTGAATAAGAVWLVAMHTVAALVLVPALASRLPVDGPVRPSTVRPVSPTAR